MQQDDKGIYCVYVEHPDTGEARTLAHVDAVNEDHAVAQVKGMSTAQALRFSAEVRGEVYAERQADR